MALKGCIPGGVATFGGSPPGEMVMPASYELDLSEGMVRTRGWGVLTDQDVDELYRRLQKDPAFRPDFRQLCDLREVTEIETTVDMLRAIARRKIFAAGVRRAFVVDRDIDYGLSRLFGAYSETEGAMIQVFRSWQEAVDWVG